MTPFVRSWYYTSVSTVVNGILQVSYYIHIKLCDKYHLYEALPHPFRLESFGPGPFGLVSFGTAVNSGNEWHDTLIDHNNIEYII